MYLASKSVEALEREGFVVIARSGIEDETVRDLEMMGTPLAIAFTDRAGVALSRDERLMCRRWALDFYRELKALGVSPTLSAGSHWPYRVIQAIHRGYASEELAASCIAAYRLDGLKAITPLLRDLP